MSSHLSHLIYALAQRRLGKNKEAVEELEKGSLIAQEVKSKVLEFTSLLIRACFAFDRGEETPGLEFLKTALCLGKDQKLINIFSDDPSVTTMLCIKALEARIEVPYVQHIIRTRRLVPETPPYHLENWPWPGTGKAMRSTTGPSFSVRGS